MTRRGGEDLDFLYRTQHSTSRLSRFRYLLQKKVCEKPVIEPTTKDAPKEDEGYMDINLDDKGTGHVLTQCDIQLSVNSNLIDIWAQRMSMFGGLVRFWHSCGVCTQILEEKGSLMSCKRHQAHVNCKERTRCVFCRCDYCDQGEDDSTPLLRYACGCMYHANENCMFKYEFSKHKNNCGSICCPFCSPPSVSEENRPVPPMNPSHLLRLSRDPYDNLIFFGPRQSGLLILQKLNLPVLFGCGLSLKELAHNGLEAEVFLQYCFIPEFLSKEYSSSGTVSPILEAYPSMGLAQMVKQVIVRAPDSTPKGPDPNQRKLNTNILKNFLGFTFGDLLGMGLNTALVMALDTAANWYLNYPELLNSLLQFPDANSWIVPLWQGNFIQKVPDQYSQKTEPEAATAQNSQQNSSSYPMVPEKVSSNRYRENNGHQRLIETYGIQMTGVFPNSEKPSPPPYHEATQKITFFPYVTDSIVLGMAESNSLFSLDD